MGRRGQEGERKSLEKALPLDGTARMTWVLVSVHLCVAIMVSWKPDVRVTSTHFGRLSMYSRGRGMSTWGSVNSAPATMTATIALEDQVSYWVEHGPVPCIYEQFWDV